MDIGAWLKGEEAKGVWDKRLHVKLNHMELFLYKQT